MAVGKYYAEGSPEPDEWLVFVSYSHDDKQLMDRLGLHLGCACGRLTAKERPADA